MKKRIPIYIYFILMLFTMYESNSYFFTASKTLYAAVQEYAVYGTYYLSAAGGALLFAVLKKHKPKRIRAFVVLGFVLAAVSICATGLFLSDGIFWGTLVFFGVMQGANIAICANYLYRLKLAEVRIGTVLASAAVAGLALNFAAELIFPSQILPAMAILSISIIVMLYLSFKKISLPGLFGVKEQDSAGTAEDRKRFLPVFWAVMIAIAALSYMIGVNDIAIFSTLLSDPAGSLFIPQALLYIPGLFIAGLLADVKEGKYLPIATLTFTLLITPVVTQISSPEVFTDYSWITYFLGGFYFIFIITSLTSLARRGRDPMNVITAGTSLYLLFLGVGAFTSNLYFQADSTIALGVFIGVVAVLLVIFYLSGNLHAKSPMTNPESLSGQSAEMLESRIKSYGLTKRESEVLRYLLDGQSTSAIAEKMVVTENTVQKYIGAMMGKCDTKSRSELITKFTRH